MSFDPFQLIKTVLHEDNKDDKNKTMDLQRLLTEKFISSSETEQAELFACRTLRIIFEGARGGITGLIGHILGLMLLFNNQFYKLKLFIDESAEQFDLFMACFMHIGNSDVAYFYQQVFRGIRMDNAESCKRMSQYLIQRVRELKNGTMMQPLQEIISVLCNKQNAALNLQLMSDLCGSMLSVSSRKQSMNSDESDQSKKRSSSTNDSRQPIVGLTVLIPKLFQIATRIINSQDEQAHYSMLEMSRIASPRVLSSQDLLSGADVLKPFLSDEEDDVDVELDVKPLVLADFVSGTKAAQTQPCAEKPKRKIKELIIPTTSQEPNLQIELNTDSFEREEERIKTEASTFFQVRKTSVEMINADGLAMATKFIDAVIGHLRGSVDNLSAPGLPPERVYLYVQELVQVCADEKNTDFLQRILPQIQQIFIALHTKQGTLAAYCNTIAQLYIQTTMKSPLAKQNLEQLRKEAARLFHAQGIQYVAQKLHGSLADFHAYLQQNGLVPLKVRTSFVAFTIKVLTAEARLHNTGLIYSAMQPRALDLFLLNPLDIEAVWTLARMQMGKAARVSVEAYQEQIDNSPISAELRELILIAPSVPVDTFKYKMFQRFANSDKEDQERKKLTPAPKYIGQTFSIKIGDKTADDSSSEDDQFNKQLEQIQKSRLTKAYDEDGEPVIGAVQDLAKQLREQKAEK